MKGCVITFRLFRIFSISAYFRKELLESYPPRLDENRKAFMGCKLCPKEFESSAGRCQTKVHYVRHLGAVHAKVYNYIGHLDFSKIEEPKKSEVKKTEPKKPEVKKSEPKMPEVKKPKVESSESEDDGSSDDEVKPTPNKNEIFCKECEATFATRIAKSLHSCDSKLDKLFLVEENQPRTSAQDIEPPPTVSTSKPTRKSSLDRDSPFKQPRKPSQDKREPLKLDLKEAKICLKRIRDRNDDFSDEDEPLKQVKKSKPEPEPSKFLEYVCPFNTCNSTFKSAFELEPHFLSVHYDELPPLDESEIKLYC